MPTPNKDLILRENLAIERTLMANDRTLLSFIRTALYFAVAGLSLDELTNLQHGFAFKVAGYIIAALLFAAGVVKYLRQLKKINTSRRLVGGFAADEA